VVRCQTQATSKKTGFDLLRSDVCCDGACGSESEDEAKDKIDDKGLLDAALAGKAIVAAGVGDAGAAASSSGAAAVVAGGESGGLVPEPAEPSEDPAVKKRRPAETKNTYERYAVRGPKGDVVGEILYNAHRGSLDCVSKKHKITLNRTVTSPPSSSEKLAARGRPLGFLVAWIFAGLETENADDLVELRKGKGPLAHLVSHAHRCSGRARVEADPAWDEFCKREGTLERPRVERQRIGAEPLEPLGLA